MIPAGNKKKLAGRFYTAQKRGLRIATGWRLAHNAVVVQGADPDAKMRAALDSDDPERIRRVVEAIQARLGGVAVADESHDIDEAKAALDRIAERERMGMDVAIAQARM